MDIALDAVRFISVIAAAIVAGGQIFCLRAVLPAMPGWPAAMSARVHQDALTVRPHTYLRLASLVMLLSGLALLILRYRSHAPMAAIGWTLVALLISGISGMISSREWPINDEINSWGAHPKIERYAELRALWDSRHVKRTWLSLAALACFVISLILEVP